MKTLLAIALFSLPTLSHGAGPACAFGETTSDLEKAFAARGAKIWYRHDHVSLSRPERLGGLTKQEKELIGEVAGTGNSLSQTLKDFSESDGYLTYFGHGTNNREFVIVASYPGDNEFGAIYEIQRNGENLKVLGIAAAISDSDLMDCQVH